MIRRDVPRGGDNPSHWLLISQIEHARISHQLAAAWKTLLPEASGAVWREFLATVLHHDDGWDDWRTDPRIDPEHGRPYGFTEMPPPLAQEIWSKSIDRCREIGPLAGWMVASHFIGLQSKRDDDSAACDFGDWARWLGEQDRRRTVWLAEWQALSEDHTAAIAEDCLYLLQQFDWLSLWLCCRGPIDTRDPAETLELGSSDRGFGPFTFTPADKAIEVSPWPFTTSTLDIVADATWADVGEYQSASDMLTKPTRTAWRLSHA